MRKLLTVALLLSILVPAHTASAAKLQPRRTCYTPANVKVVLRTATCKAAGLSAARVAPVESSEVETTTPEGPTRRVLCLRDGEPTVLTTQSKSKTPCLDLGTEYADLGAPVEIRCFNGWEWGTYYVAAGDKCETYGWMSSAPAKPQPTQPPVTQPAQPAATQPPATVDRALMIACQQDMLVATGWVSRAQTNAFKAATDEDRRYWRERYTWWQLQQQKILSQCQGVKF
jgi:hypothetical protein